MSLKNKLQEVITRWKLEESEKRMSGIAQEPGIKIGFIGKFSSGKTSLINSLLGTHFPVDINPTTKTVCIIEPCNGITKNEYYEEKNGLRREKIDFERFIALCCGDKPGIVVAKVPPSPILPEGCVFVDTPGIDSLKSEEKDTTYSYLSFLDAAVLCININEGTLNKDTEDFLLDEKLSLLHDRVVIALTHSDKMGDGIKKDAVIDNILGKLKDLIAEGKFKAADMENKVMLVNGNDAESCRQMYLDMQKHFIGKKEEIYEERRNQAYQQLKEDVLCTLREMKSVVYNNKDIEEQKNKADRELRALEELSSQKKSEIKNLGAELEKEAARIAANYSSELQGVSSDDEASIEEISSQMREELRSSYQRKIHAFFKEFTLQDSQIKDLSNGIHQKIKFNEDSWDTAGEVVAAVAAAYLGGGTGLIGNTAEAFLGGAIAKEGSTQARQPLATKNSGTPAENNAQEKGFVAQFCGLINKLNPVTYAKRLFGSKTQEKMLRNYLFSQNISMIEAIETLVNDAYQEKVIQPLLAQLEDKKNMLEGLKKEESDNFDGYIKQKESLGSDIAMLEAEQ